MSKQIKSLLKSAKRLITEKKYNEALEQCKDLLSLDSHNYNGLVFSGICFAELKDPDKSYKAYHDAINEEKEQHLAYQGLINLYNKHWIKQLSCEDLGDLIEAYEKLIQLIGSQDYKKFIELKTGLAGAYCSKQDFAGCLKTIKSTLKELKTCDLTLDVFSLYKEAIRCFMHSQKEYENLQEYSDLFYETLRHASNLADDKSDCILEKLFKLFMVFNQINPRIHVEKECMATLVKAISLLMSKNWKNTCFVWCILQVHLQNDQYISRETVKSYLSSQSESCDSFTNMLKAYDAFAKNDYNNSVGLFSSLIKRYPDFLPMKLQLCEVLLKECKWNEAEKLARSSLQDCKRLQNDKLDIDSDWLIRITSISTLKLDFTLVLGKSLCESLNPEMLKLSVVTFEKLSKVRSNSPDVYLGIVKANVALMNYPAAKHTLNQAKKLNSFDEQMKSWSAYIICQEGNEKQAVEELNQLILNYPLCFIAHFHLAKIYWTSTDASLKSKAFSTFLKAAKLNVHHGPSFYYIGCYYRGILKNSSKATRCFEKAYSLGPKSEEIGSALADQYISEGKLSSAIALYESITQNASTGECKWAWIRLGLCRLQNDEINSAIRCMQAAVRCDVDDYISWECLGEAYFLRGSYTSAWKTFHRAHELKPSSIYSLYQMAAIKQILCQFDEAVFEYKDVLNLSPSYVPALKGLGESHYSLAKTMLSEGRYQTCIDHINQAIKHLSSVIAIRSDLSCVWKLLGDCMTTVSPLDSTKVFITMPSLLRTGTVGSLPEEKILSKIQALKLGGKFYVQALRLYNSALLWHDLALNYFYQAKEADNIDDSKDMAVKATQMLQKGLSLDETNHLLWNSLGIVSASKLVQNFALAQHAFIRSIECEPNNVVAWSNLGVFYLERSQIELAHKAFKNAQSLVPSFANSWIGQALIAETIGDVDTMDLFRHATELALHGEASVGYATWVCYLVTECYRKRHDRKYKESIHDLNALSAAIVQLSKFCDLHPKCEWAFSLYGFLLEETGLNRSAANAYKHCLDLLQEKQSDENYRETDKCRTDYARVLFKIEKFSEAVAVYQSISSIKDYSTLCGFALALHACGCHNECMVAFDQALEYAVSEKEKIMVEIAMAVASWKRGDMEEALSCITPFQNSNIIDALLIISAMAVLQNDRKTLESISNRLLTCDIINYDDYNVTYRKCVIVACSLMKLEWRFARKFVERCIHKFPNDYRFRDLLSQILTEFGADRLALVCSQQSKFNFSRDKLMLSSCAHLNNITPRECLQKHQDMYANHAVALLCDGRHSTKISEETDCLKEAQRLAHYHPYSHKSWALLTGACYAKTVLSRLLKVDFSTNGLICKLSAFLANHSQHDLHAWAVKQNALSCFISNKLSEFVVPSKVDEDTRVILFLLTLFQNVSTSKELQCDQSNLTMLDKIQPSSYEALMLYCHVLSYLGEFQQAFQCLERNVSNYSCNQRIRIRLRLALLAFEASGSQPTEANDWLIKARDVLSSSGNSTAILLVLGIIFKNLKNYKKACITLNKVFNKRHIDRHCLSRSIAAWNLYTIYHIREDPIMIEKLLTQWKKYGDPYMEKIMTILPIK